MGASAHFFDPTLMKPDYSQSPNFSKGGFVNLIPTHEADWSKLWEVLQRRRHRQPGSGNPPRPVPVTRLDQRYFHQKPTQDAAVYWLGHSSMIIELTGRRYMIDPVLCRRASLWQWAGPERLHPCPLGFDQLGPVDAVLLSHDHYDHLDKSAIKALDRHCPRFIVPLGVGLILQEWGVAKEKITELDWWQDTQEGPNRLVCTPARHFSGRKLSSRIQKINPTLFCSWSMLGPQIRIFNCGDTGPLPQLSEIGERFGPFDLTIIPIGAYDPAWPAIHTTPEEGVEVHQQVQGKTMLPVHWATFDLALHPWIEPIERFVAAAKAAGIDYCCPPPGQRYALGDSCRAWWWQQEP